MYMDSPITSIKGIGEKTATLFHRMNISTVEELLSYYPRTYEKYDEPVGFANLIEGQLFSIIGTIQRPIELKRLRNKQIVTTTLMEFGVQVQLTWFHMPFLKKTLHRGDTYVFRGLIKKDKYGFSMEQPEIFKAEDYEKIEASLQPIYPLTTGLSNKLVSKSIKEILKQEILKDEIFPKSLRFERELAEYNFSIRTIHFPASKEDLLLARKRLVFEEFFFFILSVRQLRQQIEVQENQCFMKEKRYTKELIERLPYKLTNAQKRVWEEIKADLKGIGTMNRLVQGDVGSGKTILAILSLLEAAENGYQGALMAPTEVLAKQHAASIEKLFHTHKIPIQVLLLTGSMTAKEKREAYEKIRTGEAHIVIGTHALIQDKVEFQKLGLVVTDEQHRFGVNQRKTLEDKGMHPHILVMSATPIPRTLAIIVYGELDISVVDELPANRLPIKNCVVDITYRPKAYSFMEKELEKGRQVYVICPMVEENPDLEVDLENVIDYAKKLESYFPDRKIEFLHGKMKATLKNEIMERFLQKEIDILVSTTVIEVGVDVPNASVILIENSERFGMAQLHQLRGRVGRGSEQSYCIFMSNSKTPETKQRLEVLNKSNDGFHIAREDLKLRGPGDLFGYRQSGILLFQIGDIFTDATILQQADEAVSKILEEDASLEQEEHQGIKKRLEKELNLGVGIVNL